MVPKIRKSESTKIRKSELRLRIGGVLGEPRFPKKNKKKVKIKKGKRKKKLRCINIKNKMYKKK